MRQPAAPPPETGEKRRRRTGQTQKAPTVPQAARQVDRSNALTVTQAIRVGDIALAAVPAGAGDETIDGATLTFSGIEDAVPVAAKQLIDERHVHPAPWAAVTHLHLVHDRHHVLRAEGVAVVRLHVGDERREPLSDAGRADPVARCPGLRARPAACGPTARRCARGLKARLLAS